MVNTTLVTDAAYHSYTDLQGNIKKRPIECVDLFALAYNLLFYGLNWQDAQDVLKNVKKSNGVYNVKRFADNLKSLIFTKQMNPNTREFRYFNLVLNMIEYPNSALSEVENPARAFYLEMKNIR